jgi:hypothetical protein
MLLGLHLGLRFHVIVVAGTGKPVLRRWADEPSRAHIKTRDNGKLKTYTRPLSVALYFNKIFKIYILKFFNKIK